MTRLQPVNAELDSDITARGLPDNLRFGIGNALAIAPGQWTNAADYPVLGYYLTATPEQVLFYAVTPGRFVRYEVLGAQSHAVTVPLERVTQVIDHVTATGALRVLVELEVGETVSVQAPQVGDGGQVVGLVTTTRRQVYELVADTPAPLQTLYQFSLALRSALGI
jgi:hypothetical protein